jgi:Methyltransferase domain
VSRYRPHLATSLALIERAAPGRNSAIIDVGGGESTLADDLLARGYRNLTVLDVSATAIEVTRARLGAAAEDARWIVGDITKVRLEPDAYEVWHDRAVFHFQLLGPVRHRSVQAQIHLTVIRARAALVSARTALVNAARGLVKSYGRTTAQV